MEIRRIRADEGLALRGIRLRALADAPDAFGSTLAGALGYPEQEWHDRAERCATGDQVMFFAEEAGRLIGMARGSFEPEMPVTVELTSMWVEPEARGRGVARSLVEAIADWARSQGATRLQLWVTESNTPATALYRRFGFAPTGERQPLPSNPALAEDLLVLTL
jgi:GNAT superfamily N-acetyltransferase